MTLVEVIVAVVIIAVAVSSIGVVFYNTVSQVASTASRQEAAVLASSVISDLDASSYYNVGFTSSNIASAVASNSSYATTSGTSYVWTPNVDSDTSSETLRTVTTQASFTVGSSATAFAPIMSVVASKTTYQITTHVVWQSAVQQACNGGTTTLSKAYVRVFVKVTWSNGQVGNQVLYEDKLVYPGGLSSVASSTSAPAAPTSVAATAQTVTGEVVVSWTIPSGATTWSSSVSCFKVGWSNVDQNQYSSGFLTPETNVSACPSETSSTAPPTYLLYSSSTGTFSYCATGLTPGAALQNYTFYVTQYSVDGTASQESTEANANAPNGPNITAISESSGNAGDTLTITGVNLSSTDDFEFCSSTVSCTGAFAAGCATVTQWCVTPTCPSTTQCTVTVPAVSNGTSGSFFIVAEQIGSTTTITSAPQSVNLFTYQPSITSTTIAASGGTTTVTGKNLYQYSTSFTFGSVAATSVSCAAGGTSCTVGVPDNSSGVPLLVGTATLTASDNGFTSSVTYTY